MIKILKEDISPDEWTFDEEEVNPKYDISQLDECDLELFDAVNKVFGETNLEDFDPDDYIVYGCYNHEELAEEWANSMGGIGMLENWYDYIDIDSLAEDIREGEEECFREVYEDNHGTDYDEEEYLDAFERYFEFRLDDIDAHPLDYFTIDELDPYFNYDAYGYYLDDYLQGGFSDIGYIYYV